MRVSIQSVVFSAAIAVAGFTASLAQASDYARIWNHWEFEKHVVGHKLWSGKNNYTIHKNGHLDGWWAGKDLAGSWEWKDGYWCRTLTTHSYSTDCQVWESNGHNFRITRNRGNGEQLIVSGNEP